MLKPNISPKSPRIELSSDTFAELKKVFAYESKTFHCRRPNDISHCMENNPPPKKTSPSHCTTWTPSNTAMHRRAPNSPQKYPFPWTDPQTLRHPLTRPTYDAKRHPGPIRRFSTIHWTDRRTHVRTDRQILHGKV